MLTVAIIEDSLADRENLERFLTRYGDDTGMAVRIDAFDRAELFLQDYKPIYDVVFMDIMLPYMNGMDAAGELRKLDTEVALIFCTDMAQYALAGYKVNALDYFLKPVTYYDLKLRMDRICMLKESQLSPVVIHIPGEGDRILSSQDVYYIEIMNKNLTYHTTKGELDTRGIGLKKLESDLAEAGFCRVNSSYLVNLKWCEDVIGDTVTVAGARLNLSRGMKKNFVTRLSETLLRTSKTNSLGEERN